MSDEIKSLSELDTVSDASQNVVEAVVVREPARDDLGRSYATGKRKDAVARVWLKPGSGKVLVNGKEMNDYFARPVLQMILRQPFQVAGVEDQFDVIASPAPDGDPVSSEEGAARVARGHHAALFRLGHHIHDTLDP